MSNHSQVKIALSKLHNELAESSAIFNLIIIGMMIVQVVLIANTELVYNSGSMLFFLSFAPMAIGMFFVYKKMVKDPLMLSINLYIDAVRASNLTGDELLSQKLLPNNFMIGRFRKYNVGLQRAAINKLYHGISHLTFSIDESGVEEEFKKTIAYIKIAKPHKN